jgi:hypothetical protein
MTCRLPGRRLLLLVLLVAAVGAKDYARADFVFAPPTHLGPPFSGPFGEGLNCISTDGLEFYFSSNRAVTP